MNKSISILLFLLSGFFMFAQEYREKGAVVKELLKQVPKGYDHFFKQLQENENLIYDPSLNYAKKEYPFMQVFGAHIGLMHSDSVIKKSFDEGLQNSPHATCSSYSSLFEMGYNQSYLEKVPLVYFYLHREKPYYDSICACYFDKYDRILLAQLVKIKMKDQLHRDTEAGISDEQIEIDQENRKAIADIIDKIGKYPGKSLVGSDYDDAAWLVIQHSDKDYILKYLPMIQEAVRIHDLDDKYLAYTLDKLSVWDNQPQKYGTQSYFKEGKKVLYSLLDNEMVNQYRKEVGLDIL